MRPKETAIGKYLNELVNFGGTPTTRGGVISILQSEGFTQREIDYWFIGYGQTQKGKGETNHAMPSLRL